MDKHWTSFAPNALIIKISHGKRGVLETRLRIWRTQHGHLKFVEMTGKSFGEQIAGLKSFSPSQLYWMGV